jgi:hypothetical protein
LFQKKFYCNENKILKKQIKIKSKSKKKLSKINLQKEIEKLNKKIDLNTIMTFMEFFKDFKGFIVLYKFEVNVKNSNEKELVLGIAFFNK